MSARINIELGILNAPEACLLFAVVILPADGTSRVVLHGLRHRSTAAGPVLELDEAGLAELELLVKRTREAFEAAKKHDIFR